MLQQQDRDLKLVTEEMESLRDVLNELVADMERPEEEVLNLSERLDMLINEYIIKKTNLDDNKNYGEIRRP